MRPVTSLYQLRPATAADEGLLFQIYASTRQEELDQTGWDQAQRQAFLQMQFEAQRRHYVDHYPGAEFLVIMQDECPTGRLYLHQLPQEIRIMDIALLPEYRRHGLGSAVLGDILAQATRLGKTVSIHVERFNPALRLYERLGFRLEQAGEVYLLLRWSPEEEGK